MRVFLIGESIIDEYIFVKALGTASKDPVLSTRKINEEKYAGGVLAVANHLANFVDEVHMITILGKNNSQKEFIDSHLNNKIKSNFFVKENAETIVKTRLIEEKRLTKLFKIENSDGKVISASLEKEIEEYLQKNLSKYDLVMITDFGHGFLTKNLREYIVKHASYLAINVQTNSSNFGFNPLSKYISADFVSLNHQELKMYFQNDEEKKDHLLEELIKTEKYKKILLTASNEGVIYYDGKKITNHKAFNTRPLDTIGAGDALFSISSLYGYIGEDKVIPELANIVGAIKIQTLGNKESITKKKLYDFIEKRGT